MLSATRDESVISMDDGGAATLPMRPLPIRCLMSSFQTETGQVVTAITREWKPGDTPRCRLCTVCTAHNNRCLVQTDTFKPGDVAQSFSIVGTEFQAPA
jgi:hypothetical protein